MNFTDTIYLITKNTLLVNYVDLINFRIDSNKVVGKENPLNRIEPKVLGTVEVTESFGNSGISLNILLVDIVLN